MANRPDISQRLKSIDQIQAKLEMKRSMLIEKGLNSQSVDEVFKANLALNDIQTREQVDRKSYLFDPLETAANMGFKDRNITLSYNTLKGMSRTPIINSIIKTRIDQVASFCEPQSDKHSTGYIIRKKRLFGVSAPEKELTAQESKQIEYIYNFIENCGNAENFENDDFDTFIRKTVKDSLVFDQMTYEIIRDNAGRPHSFVAVDASTCRLADSYDDDEKNNSERFNNRFNYNSTAERKKGYLPSYVQLEMGIVKAEFYPWELCFGIRNPDANIYNNGYGVSELEEMITTVTSMLYSDEYNRRFFMQGSAPKGIIKVNGNISESKLKEFRQQWKAMMGGVYNSWKTPIMEAEKMEFIDLQKNNRDMEYSHWQEYLIRLACALYRIDPSEIGFIINGGGNTMFQDSGKEKLEFSKTKGLYPILKFVQKKINKYIVSRIDPNYEFVFTGMDAMSPTDELDQDLKKAGVFMTINEVREKYSLKPIEGGDIPANAVFTGAKSQEAQMQMQKEQFATYNGSGQQEDAAETGSGNDLKKAYDDYQSPLVKSFVDFVEKDLIEI